MSIIPMCIMLVIILQHHLQPQQVKSTGTAKEECFFMGIKPLLPHTLYILRQRSKEQNSNLVLVDTNLNKTEVFEIKEVGYIPLVSYLLSLEAKLVLQDRRIRDEYAIIKNKVLSYKGVKSRISFKRESFNVGRTKLICLTIREKKMSLLVSCPQVLCEDSKVKYKMLEDD